MNSELLPSSLLEDYQVRGKVNILDVNHVGIVHRGHGTRVVMPERIFRDISDQPAISDVIGRVAAFTSMQAGYRNRGYLSDSLDVSVLKLASVNSKYDRFDYASVYQDKATGVIIKSYDLSVPTEPLAQYSVMSRLAQQYNSTSPVDRIRQFPLLRAAEQYAMISPQRGHHRTVIMQNVGGLRLDDALRPPRSEHNCDYKDSYKARLIARSLVRGAVRVQTPRAVRPLLNDLTQADSLHNIHIPAPDTPLTSSNVTDVLTNLECASIIDQPGSTYTAAAISRIMGVGQLTRLLDR